MKIAALTFGCKINQYETVCIINEFYQAGWQQVDFSQQADLYLINTCTVTNRTDYKSRNAIRKALKHKAGNPDCRIIVTGCYAQLNYQAIKELGDIDYIIDNNHKNMVFQIFQSRHEPGFADINKEHDFAEQTTDSMLNRSRAFLKIQDGCDYNCAYCAVTQARGPSRSRHPQNILLQVNALAAKGYSEIVLAGVNLGLYGYDKKDNYYLTELIQDIAQIPDIKMIRLSSIEPQLFSARLLTYIQNSTKICPHFHIPMQSGSDEILLNMGRNYSQSDFRELINALQKASPFAAIGLDVIVGLPGETEELFQQTKAFLEEMPFAYFHVFPYSHRPDTRASEMPDQVHGTVTHQRAQELTALSLQKKAAYQQKLIDNKIVLSAVIEDISPYGISGLSDHYIRIHCPSGSAVPGDLVQGIPIRALGEDLMIEVIK
ncbi:MAG: tRNA (N(6)-L-threonylcarbamoyladenosine(37)-C(2))-methylthiotransferase MtaB [Candidatus Cloacimonetes bacterium]|nr:tRNA (N(6)-L-threonylcarbamoyladenosine(37)-C(2))-methylthiotransferase MtaB [Candidatus Cloacimonadota bacterium]